MGKHNVKRDTKDRFLPLIASILAALITVAIYILVTIIK